MQDLFSLALVLLAAGAVAAALSARLRLPTLLGYLAAGIVLGPSVSGLLKPGPALGFLAELGVVLLMFMVGLEFSVGELWATRRRVLSAGTLQMGSFGVAVALAADWAGVDARGAILLGGAAAMSSSAIAAKALAEQGELTTRHGRMAVAVLVFQDVATIPLLILLAIWQRGGTPAPGAIALEVVRVLALFAVAAVFSKPLLQRVMAWVARHGSAEVFLLCALLLVLTAAYGAHALGISAALGAFLAGMVLGESDFRHRMEDDIRPFRDLLIGLFFITVGLQMDARQLIDAPWAVLAWLAGLVPLKLLLAWPALRLAGLGRTDAWRSALILAHGGEFGLLLIASALAAGILPAAVGQPALVALVLSMAATPLMIRHHERLARALSGRVRREAAAPQDEENTTRALADRLDGHAIVCGAGNLGRMVSLALDVAGMPHLVLESDYEAYRAARAAGLAVLYGDASRINTLRAAGIERARMLVITFHRLEPALRIAHWARETHPALPTIATCLTEAEARRLQAIPGVRVYVEKLAAGLALAEQTLLEGGLAAEDADRLIAALREQLQSTPLPIDPRPTSHPNRFPHSKPSAKAGA
jgi:CPA2 family monovalent cation:H+ antiporter-2